MFSKQEKAKLTEAFWTAFGRYMTPHLSAGGEKVNWINYKTKVRHIAFRTEVSDGTATISITLNHSDGLERETTWKQFVEVKKLLEAATKEPWIWERNSTDEYGHERSRIYTSIKGVSLYIQEDWPTLISFFKPRLIALDTFWENVKYGFEM